MKKIYDAFMIRSGTIKKIIVIAWFILLPFFVHILIYLSFVVVLFLIIMIISGYCLGRYNN